MFVVISYDIADDRRRLKVAQTLLDFGGERVQRSVFECYITERNYERLQRGLRRHLDIEEDSVRFYVLCEHCRAQVNLWGVARPIERPALRII
jgi:CRISPR-associated protein Cas2